MNIVNNIQQDELDAGKLQEVYDIEVELGKKITLPDSFEAPHRPDMVKMAVASSRANRRQKLRFQTSQRKEETNGWYEALR